MPYAFAVPEEVVRAEGNAFSEQPVGSGPFQLKHWQPGRSLILRKNPNYYEAGLPKLDAVLVRFMGSKLSAFAAFRRGNLDLLESPPPAVTDELMNRNGRPRPKYRQRMNFHLGPQLTTEFLGFQMSDSIRPEHPLRQRQLRQAINYAIDRKQLVRYLLNGQATPATAGIVPKGMPTFNDSLIQGYSYQPQQAAELLREAGYPQGKGLPVLTLVSSPNYRHISEYVQKSLEEIGIALEIQEYEGATVRTMVEQGEVDFWRASWIADYADAENYLALFYGPNASPQGANRFRYRNARYDSLYEAALRTPSLAERQALYYKMERQLLRDAPAVVLFYYKTLRVLQPRVEGFRHSPSALHLDLRHVTVQPDTAAAPKAASLGNSSPS
jgi:peptide/nickel transport system substrate-binding protein